jgi:NAD(P)-dependent dehydrogenase (short-subunit alcohol dehydrogenase family)
LVAELGRRVAREQLALAAVVANAGVWPRRRIVTAAGLELGFAVNHVGHAALIDAVAPALGDGARVVVVASGLHQHGRIAWDVWRWRAASTPAPRTRRPSWPTSCTR